PDKPFKDITLTPEDWKMIARSKTVQALDLSKVKTSDDELKLVVGLPRLEGIILGGDRLTDAGLKHLRRGRTLDNLTLRSTKKVTDAGIKELAGLKNLQAVHLMMTEKVTDAGVKELAALPKLRSLHLYGMKLTGSAFKAFAGSKTLESVTLDFVEGFTDEGAR